MVVLDIEHPDIEDFVTCKADEERKAWTLIDAGYDGSIDGPAYSSIFFQNANNSVRVTDEFMQAVADDGEFHTRNVTDGSVAKTHRARDIFRKIADAAHFCGDPGMQYDTTINDWHTCSKTGRINASNPCSEYMHLDDSACNLASINLLKFGGRGRRVRYGGLPPCGERPDYGDGHPDRRVKLSDPGDRRDGARLPSAWSGLCESGCPAHGTRACPTIPRRVVSFRPR